ncbi:MAG: hypothetical protein IJV61_04080 [Paludibacteraceae bacterium]|nr:hypothetical protein [Paludibacteraceae bacterium]
MFPYIYKYKIYSNCLSKNRDVNLPWAVCGPKSGGISRPSI